MLLPNPGALLATLRTTLETQVMPAVENDGAKRQLKAGLHLLKRLEKSWDLYALHVLEDNQDMQETLNVLLAEIAGEGCEQAFADIASRLRHGENHCADHHPGINSPALMGALEQNLHLQQLVEKFQLLWGSNTLPAPIVERGEKALQALYGRMVERDALAMGDK